MREVIPWGKKYISLKTSSIFLFTFLFFLKQLSQLKFLLKFNYMQRVNIWKSSWIISVNFYSKSKTYMPEFIEITILMICMLFIIAFVFNLSLRYNLNSRHLWNRKLATLFLPLCISPLGQWSCWKRGLSTDLFLVCMLFSLTHSFVTFKKQ